MSLFGVGIVVIVVSAIMAWVTSCCIKNVELKTKTKTIFAAVYFVATLALAIGFLAITAILFLK